MEQQLQQETAEKEAAIAQQKAEIQQELQAQKEVLEAEMKAQQKEREGGKPKKAQQEMLQKPAMQSAGHTPSPTPSPAPASVPTPSAAPAPATATATAPAMLPEPATESKPKPARSTRAKVALPEGMENHFVSSSICLHSSYIHALTFHLYHGHIHSSSATASTLEAIKLTASIWNLRG